MPRQHHSSFENADSLSGIDAKENILNQLHRYPDRCRQVYRKKVNTRLWKDRKLATGADGKRNPNKYHHWSDNITYSISYSIEIPRFDTGKYNRDNLRKKYLGKYFGRCSERHPERHPGKSNHRNNQCNRYNDRYNNIRDNNRYNNRDNDRYNNNNRNNNSNNNRDNNSKNKQDSISSVDRSKSQLGKRYW